MPAGMPAAARPLIPSAKVLGRFKTEGCRAAGGQGGAGRRAPTVAESSQVFGSPATAEVVEPVSAPMGNNSYAPPSCFSGETPFTSGSARCGIGAVVAESQVQPVVIPPSGRTRRDSGVVVGAIAPHSKTRPQRVGG
jgi:hypothetical protein